MPQALAFVFPATFAAGGTAALFTSAGTLTALGVVTSIGTSIALSMAVRPDAPAQTTPDNIKLQRVQAVGPRIRHYGRVRGGGQVVFRRAQEGFMLEVIAHGHGEIDGVEGYFLDKTEVSIDAGGYVTDDQYVVKSNGAEKVSRVRILTRRGLVPSNHYQPVETRWPEFDAAHRLDGIWTTMLISRQVAAEDFRSVYPNGRPPEIEIVARTSKLRDPRSGAIAYSDNAALALADLIEHPDGFNLAGMVDDAMLAGAADDADDAIPLAAGGTEPRYRLAGSYALSEKPGEVLRRMLDACNGDVQLLPSGKIGVHVGKWREPAVTIGEAEIIDLQSWEAGQDRLDRYTELPWVYTDPGLGYQQTTGEAWVDAAREADNGQIAVGPQLDLSFAPSAGQGGRCAKHRIEADNPRHLLTLACKPSAMRAVYERYVSIDMPELPAVVWRIQRYRIDLASGQVVLQLRSFDPAALSWSVAEEPAPVALPEPDTSAGLPVPANFAAAGAGRRTAQNAFTAGIGLQWDAPESDALSPVAQYAPAGSDAWEAWPLPGSATSALISPLDDGADYDIRLAFETSDERRGTWAVITGVTASADASAPAAPTDLAVSDEGGGSARVSLVTSTSPGLWKTIVYRDGVEVGTFFDAPGTAIAFFDSPGVGSFSWTARSINVSGKPSATDAGPVSQTIT
ncbi:hypothetical protein [Limimaricola cinnabarinus]|uniref:Fibronectin type-III domain-containing protein n=1 Tax=Limimaricola cinnabarinus TaxID=1125964 RepID=A0A2G1MGW3_9RHOB|nr:hypothetical protein [Limimaricola cinnabarinus]PHP27993.1 hypothetical protein CJ301_08385 [Limimaricola cinnabarinus]